MPTTPSILTLLLALEARNPCCDFVPQAGLSLACGTESLSYYVINTEPT